MEELDKIVNEFFKNADEFIERQKEYEKEKEALEEIIQQEQLEGI